LDRSNHTITGKPLQQNSVKEKEIFQK